MNMNEKVYKTKGELLLFFMKGSKRYFIGSTIFIVFLTFLNLVNPKIVSFTVDSVINDKETDLSQKLFPLLEKFFPASVGTPRAYLTEHLYLIAIAVVAVALVACICRYCSAILNTKGAEMLVMTIRNKVFSHIEKLPFSWYMENKTGDIIQRCTSDVETVKRFLSDQLTNMIRIIILIISSITFMLGMNVKLTLFASAFLPVVFFFSLFFHGKFSKRFKEADEQEGILSSIAQENLTGVRVVRAFGRERYELERFNKQNEHYYKVWSKINLMLSVFWTSNDFFSGLQVLTVVALGAYYAVQGSLTAGEYIAFISYNAMLVWPVRMLGRMVNQMSKAGIAIDRIAYIMNSPAESDVSNALMPPIDRDIEFSHVSFSYEGSTEKVLDDVSFKIKAGTTLGVLGSTGSGKSTLMYLLTRLYEIAPDCGDITIGGVNIKQIKASWLRKNIGIVLQEPYLFSRTLGENISIGMDKATDRDVRDAARTASLLDTVEGFAKGFDTFVGERGVTLSGGQKQRAAIAQMIIHDTPVMIFDDSLSAVDTETDAKIREALREKSGKATVIIIAHRITTLMDADDIIVLDRCKVEEEGTHEKLLKKDGIYKRIYDIQTAGGLDKEEEM